MLATRVQPVRAPAGPADRSPTWPSCRAGPAAGRARRELRRRVRERAWQHQGSGEVADPVPLAELQAALGADTALVAYVVTADRVVALVVTDHGTRRTISATATGWTPLLGGLLPDLDMAASELPDAMAGSCAGSWPAGSAGRRRCWSRRCSRRSATGGSC